MRNNANTIAYTNACTKTAGILVCPDWITPLLPPGMVKRRPGLSDRRNVFHNFEMLPAAIDYLFAARAAAGSLLHVAVLLLAARGNSEDGGG